MVKKINDEAVAASMPEHVEPMLCTLVKEPVDSQEYLYEMKWDGYRIVSRVENGSVRMNSRSGLDYTSRYPLIAEALQSLDHNLMIDGEVVVLNEEGIPDFDSLQLYNGKRTPIRYCVFDLLYLHGNSVMDLPLYQRKELLETLTKDHEVFLFSQSFDDGTALYKKVLKDNLEGIVAKKKDSVYVPGARGYDWLKVPTRKRQEFVIGGWAESDKSRSFKHLLFGTYEDGQFTWIGRSGGGYKQSEMPGILKMLEEIETKKSPFVNKILDTKGAKMHYVEPKLVANFEFATWTKTGRIRKPATFLGFRQDKNPSDVVREVPKETEEVEQVIAQRQEEDQQQEPASAEERTDLSLEKYNNKRRFEQTPEPTGGKAGADKLIFVVQKHNASHLHYDFRLEMRGVLKSWAVPKGPSMNPADHRLAMAVEDHPYDYKDFEGIIPEGQYGGGTVLVWDYGTYAPEEHAEGKPAQEHLLLSSYYKNKLSIVLQGQKLRGRFNLIKTSGRGENAWLLTKVKDDYALLEDITKKDQSVRSGLTILEVAMNSHSKVWQSNREPEIKRSTRSKISPESNWNKIFDEKINSEGTIEIENQKLQLTNIEKKLWRTTNKAQLITYYNSVAEYILPYLKQRPLSLLIKNLSAQAPGFYIKDMEGFQPQFVDIYSAKRKTKAKGKPEIINYAVCNNLPALLWLINLGCIDLNPWNSTIENPGEPDFIAIDLDPSDDDFTKVVKTAMAAREYFNEQQLSSFLKTSGKTGIHIFVPCTGFSYAQARKLAERICAEIHIRVPEITTLEVSVDKRGNKLFIDFSQNDEADTLASAYSVRPAKQPSVSTPIHWEELTLKLKPADFTMENISSRLLEKGDLWKDLHNREIKTNNSSILKQILAR